MSAVPAIRGLFVDLVAPCREDGTLLAREYHTHLRRMARVKEVQGVVVNGPAGEASALDREARARILAAAMAAAPAGFPVLAALRADTDAVADEARDAVEQGAAGVVVLCSGAPADRAAVEAVLATVPGTPVVAWGAGRAVSDLAGLDGVSAVVTPDRDELNGTATPVMLTDASVTVDVLHRRDVAGAVLASANVAEAKWAKVFRHAEASPETASRVYDDHLAPLVGALPGVGAEEDRRLAGAIKHALCTLTQNTSGATLAPKVDIGDQARAAVDEALTDARLMPGMS